MKEPLFTDNESTPWSNYIGRFLVPALIISFIMIVMPVYTEGLDKSALVFIIPCVCLLLYHAIVTYIYSRRYLSKLELQGEDLILTIVGMGKANDVLIMKNDNTGKIEMTESLLSFNTLGISNWVVSFIQNDKSVFKQYQVGNWNTSTFKKVLLSLKEKGFVVNSSTSLIMKSN